MKQYTLEICAQCGSYSPISGMCARIGRSVKSYQIDEECPLDDAALHPEPRTCETCAHKPSASCSFYEGCVSFGHKYWEKDGRHTDTYLSSRRSSKSADVETVREALKYGVEFHVGLVNMGVSPEALKLFRSALAALDRIAGVLH